MSQDFTPQLLQAHSILTDLLAHIQSFDTARFLYHAPIVDKIRCEPWRQEEVMGLKKFVEGVEHSKRQVDAILRSGVPPQDDPLPSVQGLLAFWKIIITAQTPVVGIKMAMGGERYLSAFASANVGNGQGGKGYSRGAPQIQAVGKGKGKDNAGQRGKDVWVDVIAQGGREWIRIYSKKISHLLAEFREADSYINSDFDSDSDSDHYSRSASGDGVSNNNGESSIRARPALSNSLIKSAEELLEASMRVDRIPGAPRPSLTIRLTRLPSLPSQLTRWAGQDRDQGDGGHKKVEEEAETWPDARIPASYEVVRRMGIKLVFGDLADIPLSSPSLCGQAIPAEAVPCMRFNLDITTLMGLCSDVLHHPLPANKEEAKRRSLRPSSHLLANGNTTPRGRDGTGRGSGKGKKELDGSGAGLDEDEEDVKGQSQNSRELYRCILEEMERPFIDEFEKVVVAAWTGQQRPRRGDRIARGRGAPSSLLQQPHSDETRIGIDSSSDQQIYPALSMQLTGADSSFVSVPVEFWTTRQAATYTYEALSSGPAHGHGGEQRRMRRMLGHEEGDFFEGSRYEGRESVFREFRVRVFDEPAEEDVGEGKFCGASKSAGLIGRNRKEGEEEGEEGGLDPSTLSISPLSGRVPKTGFHHTLEAITATFLDEYYDSTSSAWQSAGDTAKGRGTSRDSSHHADHNGDLNAAEPGEKRSTNKKAKQASSISISAQTSSSLPLPSFLQPKKMPSPPVAKITLPFPVVSLHSLHRGAKEGMTTIMMGTATLKEVWTQNRWRVRGWERGHYVFSSPDSDGAFVESENGVDGDRDRDRDREREDGPAAVIIFPYRVFGEGKRVRFEQGDWSYPTDH